MKPDVIYEKRKKRIWIPILIIFVLLVALTFSFYFYIVSIPATSDSEEKMFEVQAGQSSTEISENLEKEGIIKDARIFEFYAWTKGLDDKLHCPKAWAQGALTYLLCNKYFPENRFSPSWEYFPSDQYEHAKL